MKRASSKLMLNMSYILRFFLFCIVFTSINTFSRQQWQPSFMEVIFDDAENSVTFKFLFFDYDFGPASENGYLRVCDFAYSTDNKTYTHLMRAEAKNQRFASWTWLNMRYKRRGAQIQFIDCYKPENKSLWPDNDNDVRVEVNTLGELVYAGSYYLAKAYFTVKWFLDESYKDVTSIQITGFWKVNGVYCGDNIKYGYTKSNYKVSLKSENLNDSCSSFIRNKAVKVTTEADQIVIKGAEPGENIKVYNTSGTELKSFITNNEVIKIKLPKNQIYIVQIDQARYKITL